MSTGKRFRVAAMAAGLAFTVFFTGCGGGDDAGVGGDAAAPDTLQGRSYNFSPDTGGQTAVSFTSPTAYSFQHENGAVEQGTYAAARDGNTWSVTLQSTTGGQQIYEMTFASANSGSFVLKRAEEADRFGPFSARDQAIPDGDVDTDPVGETSGSTTGTTSGTTSGATTDGTTTTGNTTTGNTTSGSTTTSTTSGATTSGGNVTPSNEYTGFSPVSIAGRTMIGTRTFTSTGPSGQTHVYTFGNGTFHDSDPPEEADGTFTYAANRGSATMTLNYTSPTAFANDTHTLTMTFTQKDRGNFESTYTRGDGTQIVMNGTFEFEPIP